MNLLVNLFAEDGDLGASLRRAQKRQDLIGSLMEVGLIPTSVPSGIMSHPAVSAARLDFMTRGEWERRWSDLIGPHGGPDMKPGEVDGRPVPVRWTAAVEAGSYVYLLPQDDISPEGDLQLFTRVGPLVGRLRMIGIISAGKIEYLTDARFESALHCADQPCDSNSDCIGCCDQCSCQGVIYRGSRGLRCHCSVHGIS